MKPPRFPTVFEAVVNAFACQQLSLEVALELLNRLAALCGARAGTRSDVRFAFPTAQDWRGSRRRSIRRLDSADRRKMRCSASRGRSREKDWIWRRVVTKTTLSFGDACSNCRELAAGVPSTCCSGVSVGWTFPR